MGMTCWRKNPSDGPFGSLTSILSVAYSTDPASTITYPSSQSQKKCQPFHFHISLITPIYFQVLCLFSQKKTRLASSDMKPMAFFSHPCFAHPQISRHPSIPMPKWTWWDGHLNLSIEGKYHPTKTTGETSGM